MEKNMQPDELPSYATLHFLVRRGAQVAMVFGLLPVMAGIAASLGGMSPLLIVAGLVAGAALYLIMCSYVELVRVIVDMLLPK